MRTVTGIDSLTWCLPDDLPERTVDVIERGRYKEVELAAAALAFRDDDVILEAGGGVGYVAYQLLNRGLHLVSLEPLRPHFDCLLANLGNVWDDQHLRLPHALGLEDGQATLYQGPNGWDSSTRLPKTITSEAVHLVRQHSADQLVEEYDLTAVMLDMEGAEAPVLLGMDLEPIRAVVAELHHVEDFIQVGDRLVDAGFVQVLYATKNWEQTTWVGAWRRP